MGVYMSLEPERISRHKWPIFTAFVIIGVMGLSATYWQAHLGNIEKGEQKAIYKKLQEELNQSNLSQEFMKGQLRGINKITRDISQAVSDPGLKQMAGAIEKIAQSSPAIISSMGNLKQRAITLSDEITKTISFWEKYLDDPILRRGSNDPKVLQERVYTERMRAVSDLKFKYSDKILDIRNELAKFHYQNEHLDWFIKTFMLRGSNEFPEKLPRESLISFMQIYTPLSEFKEVTNDLKKLSDQIKD
jgi:hypothetical protein